MEYNKYNIASKLISISLHVAFLHETEHLFDYPWWCYYLFLFYFILLFLFAFMKCVVSILSTKNCRIFCYFRFSREIFLKETHLWIVQIFEQEKFGLVFLYNLSSFVSSSCWNKLRCYVKNRIFMLWIKSEKNIEKSSVKRISEILKISSRTFSIQNHLTSTKLALLTTKEFLSRLPYDLH